MEHYEYGVALTKYKVICHSNVFRLLCHCLVTIQVRLEKENRACKNKTLSDEDRRANLQGQIQLLLTHRTTASTCFM